MAIATVVFFNHDKGYGFIAPENGETDVFAMFPRSKAQIRCEMVKKSATTSGETARTSDSSKAPRYFTALDGRATANRTICRNFFDKHTKVVGRGDEFDASIFEHSS